MSTATTTRVPEHTAEHVNRWIQEGIERNVAYFAHNPHQIDHRLRELDREWDIERTLEANAATLALAGTIMGAAHDRRWLFVPTVVTAFLLQHAVQGWCPPVPIFRRHGVRTALEISDERVALRILRGDFGEVLDPYVSPETRARQALEMVRSR